MKIVFQIIFRFVAEDGSALHSSKVKTFGLFLLVTVVV